MKKEKEFSLTWKDLMKLKRKGFFIRSKPEIEIRKGAGIKKGEYLILLSYIEVRKYKNKLTFSKFMEKGIWTNFNKKNEEN